MDDLRFIGNVGKDPVLKYTPQGQAVCSFPVAVNRVWKDKEGNQQKQTIWFRVEAWGANAENCNQYLKSGSKVYCQGQLKPDKSTGGPVVFDKQDGSKGASYEVRLDRIEFLSRKDSEAPKNGDQDE